MIVLDTHVLVWWVNGDDTLPTPAAAEAIVTEMQGDGRIDLSMDPGTWLSLVGAIDAIRFAPVDNDIAVQSVALPGEFHEDPAGRITLRSSTSGVPLAFSD